MSSSADTSDIAFLYVTFPSRDIAGKFARECVEARLAACANIFGDHESIYRWKDKVEVSNECAALFKTTKACVDALTTAIAKSHPYETPCIAVLTPKQVNTSFAQWIRESVENRK